MDQISDMLTLIRNAILVKHSKVDVPFSNLKYEISKILEREGFISKVEKEGKKDKKFITIALDYNKDKSPKISGLKRVSRCGRRVYVKASEIKPVKSGTGIAIISTSKGLMTDKEAKRNKIGGEIICEIW